MKVRMKSIMAGPGVEPAMLYQEIDVDEFTGKSLIHGGHATLVVPDPVETATPDKQVETADARPKIKRGSKS